MRINRIEQGQTPNFKHLKTIKMRGLFDPYTRGSSYMVLNAFHNSQEIKSFCRTREVNAVFESQVQPAGASAKLYLEFLPEAKNAWEKFKNLLPCFQKKEKICLNESSHSSTARNEEMLAYRISLLKPGALEEIYFENKENMNSSQVAKTNEILKDLKNW